MSDYPWPLIWLLCLLIGWIAARVTHKWRHG
jgi:hypothetical protein